MKLKSQISEIEKGIQFLERKLDEAFQNKELRKDNAYIEQIKEGLRQERQKLKKLLAVKKKSEWKK